MSPHPSDHVLLCISCLNAECGQITAKCWHVPYGTLRVLQLRLNTCARTLCTSYIICADMCNSLKGALFSRSNKLLRYLFASRNNCQLDLYHASLRASRIFSSSEDEKMQLAPKLRSHSIILKQSVLSPCICVYVHLGTDQQ